MAENNRDPIINPEDLTELTEKQSEKSNLTTMSGVLFGLIVVMIFHNFYSIYNMLFDDSIPLVHCPREFSLDRPVILKRVAEMDARTTDNWVKGFVINYVMKLYPRNIEDSKSFFQYIADHSTGTMASRYKARVSDIEDVNREIENRNLTKFWITDSEKIIIRKVSSGVWNVVVFGFMHRRNDGEIMKMQPRIELTVETVGSRLSNPEGLVVSDVRLVQITDPVSGEEVEL